VRHLDPSASRARHRVVVSSSGHRESSPDPFEKILDSMINCVDGAFTCVSHRTSETTQSLSGHALSSAGGEGPWACGVGSVTYWLRRFRAAKYPVIPVHHIYRACHDVFIRAWATSAMSHLDIDSMVPTMEVVGAPLPITACS
jgi:hypothetical protein